MTATNTSIPSESLVAFRVGFGLLMLFSLLRFVWKGWVQAYYLVPTYFFTYSGFGWVKPWTAYGLPEWTLYLHIGVLCLCCIAIVFGCYYRAACALFFVGFTYLELIDKTFYLNHYYAMSLFAFLMIWLPLNQSYALQSISLRGCKKIGKRVLPLWSLRVLQLQVAIVYIFAGLAKLNADWLVSAEPLRRWLPSFANLPVVGTLFAIPATAWIMAWAGLLFDLGVVFFLCHSRFRPWAYACVLGFHLLTALLFPIGLFPWMMMFVALLYFSPQWPVVLWRCLTKKNLTKKMPTDTNVKTRGHDYARLKSLKLTGLGVFFIVQILLPLRHHFYPGNVLWTEEGFRFAWNVMLIEKTGWVEFTLKDPSSEKFWVVQPDLELTSFQAKMMSTQPDMILQYAHHLLNKEALTYPNLEVYAESFAALNGRPSQYYIRPDINLALYSSTKGIIQPLQQ